MVDGHGSNGQPNVSVRVCVCVSISHMKVS